MSIAPARRLSPQSVGATTLVVVWLTITGLPAAQANGLGGPTVIEPPTRFEAFVASTCAPCVQDAYAVATVSVTPLKLAGFTGTIGGLMARAGEVRFEVVRAYPLGRASQQLLAVRGTLFITGTASPPYRFAIGMVDEGDFRQLAAAVSAMATALLSSPSGEPASDTMEMEAHAGSIRVGAIRIAESVTAYVQFADLRFVRPPSLIDAQAAMFLSVTELPRLQQVLEQVAERLGKLRGR